MQCQKCKKKQATVHMTEISGDQKEEIHLCEECAQEHGLTMKGQVSLADFLAGLIKAPITQEMSRLAKLQCPSCGISYLEFQSKGRFGCPKDYEVFAKLVEPLLDKVHGAVEHSGKVPVKAPEGDAKGARLTTLRRMLKAAIDDEKYEEAAAIRDQIRKIEGGEIAAE
jgi:protein arginine kinase activator